MAPPEITVDGERIRRNASQIFANLFDMRARPAILGKVFNFQPSSRPFVSPRAEARPSDRFINYDGRLLGLIMSAEKHQLFQRRLKHQFCLSHLVFELLNDLPENLAQRRLNNDHESRWQYLVQQWCSASGLALDHTTSDSVVKEQIVCHLRQTRVLVTGMESELMLQQLALINHPANGANEPALARLPAHVIGLLTPVSTEQ